MKFTFFPRRHTPSARDLPTKLDVEVREEIRFCLEMRAQELMKDGFDPEEAWRAAVAAGESGTWAQFRAMQQRPRTLAIY